MKCLLPLVAALMACTPAAANDEREAIIAQTAGVMASTDFARNKCHAIKVNQKKLNDLIRRSGKTEAELRSDESYDDQKNVLAQMEKSSGVAMICMVLHSAHGGYARGVLTR